MNANKVVRLASIISEDERRSVFQYSSLDKSGTLICADLRSWEDSAFIEEPAAAGRRQAILPRAVVIVMFSRATHFADGLIRQRAGSGFRIAFLLLALASAGCPGPAAPPQAEPASELFRDLQIDIAVPEQMGVETNLAAHLDEWSAQTGAKAHVQTFAPRDAERIFETAGANGNSPVVAVVPLRALPELIAANSLARIPEELQGEDHLDWLGLFPGVRQSVASVEGLPTVIPLSCATLVLYYRADLLEKAGLHPPQTWDEYRQLVQTLEQWAPEKTAVEPWSDEWRATLFLARAVALAKHPSQFSLFFDFRTAEPLIDTPGFVRSLELSLDILKQLPDECRGYSPEACRNEIVAGRAALAIGFEPHEPALQAAEGATIACLPLPGSPTVFNRSTGQWESPPAKGLNRVTLAGFDGWCLTVSSAVGERNQLAGWNLVNEIGVSRPQFALPGRLFSLCRESQIADETRSWAVADLPRNTAISYRKAVAASLGGAEVVQELPVVGAAKFRQALTEGLTTAIDRGATPQDALARVQQSWQTILEEVGKTKVLNSYRRSLGLSPLD